MSKQYKISEDTITFLNKQCSLIKKGFLLLPIGLIIMLTYLLKIDKGEKSIIFIVVPMLVISIIYLRSFVIMPIIRLKNLSLIISEISINDLGIEVFTKQLLWRSRIFSFIPFEELKITNRVAYNMDNLFGYKPAFQLTNLSTKEYYYLSSEMFSNKEEVAEFIEELKMRSQSNPV